MKRMWTILLAALLLLSGCQRPEDASILPAQARLTPCAAELGGSTYYLQGRTILVWDSAEDAFVPLCRDPGCDHKGPQCAAFVDTKDAFARFLAAAEGSLWFVSAAGESMGLYRMDPASLQRTLVYTLPPVEDLPGAEVTVGYQFLDTCVAVDVEPMYLFNASYLQTPEASRVQKIMLLDLETGALSQPFAELLAEPFHGIYPRITRLTHSGAYLLFERTTAVWDEEAHSEVVTSEIIRWNIKTGKYRAVPLEPDAADLCLTASKAFYVQSGGSFVELDLPSGRKKTIPCALPQPLFAKYDEAGILLYLEAAPDDALRTYGFFDRSYHLLDQIRVPQALRPMLNLEDRIFFGTGDDTITAYLDKSAIGSGELKLIRTGP